MIQADIYKVLSESTSVAAIVSSRIYPVEIPQGGIVPAVVFSVNNISPIKSLDGESGLDNGNVEIICWAKDYTTAYLLASAVREAFAASGIGVMTDDMQDTRDEETRAFGVIMTMSAWSEPTLNHAGKTWPSDIEQRLFNGDGSTTEFILPKFRSGSLLVFFNGRLAKKGLEADLTAAYWEKSTLDGFVFRVAPKGGDYKDELLAFYQKV